MGGPGHLLDMIQRAGGRLLVTEIDGKLWASDSHWMMPYGDSQAEALVKHWNLTPPGVFLTDRDRLFSAPADVDPPATVMASVLHQRPAKNRKLAIRMIGTLPTLVEADGGLAVVAGAADGQVAVLRRDYLDLVNADWLSGPPAGEQVEMLQDEPLHPVYLPEAVLMPIRIAGIS